MPKGLNFLRIADRIIQTALTLILGTAAMAVAIAFGWGERDTAAVFRVVAFFRLRMPIWWHNLTKHDSKIGRSIGQKMLGQLSYAVYFYDDPEPPQVYSNVSVGIKHLRPWHRVGVWIPDKRKRFRRF
jgi:hypothetical protein